MKTMRVKDRSTKHGEGVIKKATEGEVLVVLKPVKKGKASEEDKDPIENPSTGWTS